MNSQPSVSAGADNAAVLAGAGAATVAASTPACSQDAGQSLFLLIKSNTWALSKNCQAVAGCPFLLVRVSPAGLPVFISNFLLLCPNTSSFVQVMPGKC